MLTKLFFPEVAGMRVDRVFREGHTIHLVAVLTRRAATCPLCGWRSTRIRSRYRRTLADLPCAGDVVTLHLQTRRFRCGMPSCRRRIFTERLPALVAPFARRTARLQAQVQRDGFALGGAPGARHATAAGMPVSARTVLRRVRATPLPASGPVAVLGVDDWAQRKGRTYGTILVNLEAHRVLDLLPDRTADTLAVWLAARPGIELISRDRAGAYAEGARRGAPQAVQVADRFHLLKNLTDVLARVLSRQHRALRAAAQAVLHAQLTAADATAPPAVARAVAPSLAPPPLLADASLSAALQERRRGRDEAVLALHREGVAGAMIARRLGLTRPTVRRIVRAGVAAAGERARSPSVLAPYEPYLWEQWTHGCQNARVLWQDIRAQGFTGSSVHLRRALRGWRTTPAQRGRAAPLPALPATPARPTLRLFSPREATWLLLHAADTLDVDEDRFLTQLTEEWPEVRPLQQLGQQFGDCLRRRDQAALATWLAAAEQSGIPEFRGFVTGLRRDLRAVTAALQSHWSNGQTEGQVNRLKTLKRAMYGRAHLDLLRLRMLYAA